MLSVGFRQADDMADPMVIWIPKHLTLENIQDAFRLMDYPTSLRNSVTLGVVSSLLQILSCALVGLSLIHILFTETDFKPFCGKTVRAINVPG